MSASSRYFREPHILRYDPQIRDYVVLSDGETDSMHYVDQRVALLLNINQGTLSGDSTLGNELRKIKRAGGAVSTADAKRAIMSALEPAINDNEITVLDIVVKYPTHGRMDIYVIYRNEILSKSLQPRTVPITIGGNSNG